MRCIAAVILACAAAGKVPTVPLADGSQLPLVCLGTGFNKRTTFAVQTALEVGWTCVDSGLIYGNQPAVARGLAKYPRDSYYLMSKVPGCGFGFTVLKRDCYGGTMKAIQKNNRRLNVSSVDLLLLHFPPVQGAKGHHCDGPKACGMMQDQWRALEQAKAAGHARSIGVSNYCPVCFECLKQTAKELPVVNQLEWHVGQGPDMQGFKSYFDGVGVQVQAYSPLGPTGDTGALIHDDDCKAIGMKHNVSSVQVALKWLVRRAPTLSRSGKREHLMEDIDLWSFDLDDEDVARLDARTTPAATTGSPSFGCRASEALV